MSVDAAATPNVARLPRVQWDLLGPLLRCPNCAAETLQLRVSSVRCEVCAREYNVENDVIDFLGDTPPPTPPFYADPAYRAFIAHLAEMHEAHYMKGGPSAFIEKSIKHDLFRLVIPSDDLTVDLGCGLGEGFKFMGRDEDILGLDFELGLLNRTRKLHPRAHLMRADFANLPFRDGVLKRVFAIGVLEHVFHLEAAMGHLQRALARDGVFYVAVPTEGSLAVETARLVTSARNGRIIGISAAESSRAQRKDHCNTVFLIENVLRKFFEIDRATNWPFRIGGDQINLSKNFRLTQIAPR